MVKEYLSQRGINFQQRDVSRNLAYAQELMNNTGQMGVPVTIINQQTVVGFDRSRLEQLLTQTQVGQRPSFGASIADASKITAKQDLGITLGAYIGRVRPGTAAERIGLASGDIVIELNMRNIANARDLESALSGLNKGNRLTLIFLRGNKKMTTQGTY
jgi:S1-C subfamily serine protease